MSVLPAWKMNTALASPPPFSVSVPVRPTEEAELYTPGTKLSPPRSEVIGEVGPWPAALLKAVTKSVLACWVMASPPWLVPVIVIDPVPLIEVVG